MDLSRIFHTTIQKSVNLQGKASLQPGQIVFGKINRLFPNQTAEVQIGNQKWIAKLEIPLSAGEKYWFQVQTGEGKLNLKVLYEGNGIGSGDAKSLEGVLIQLGLPASKENLEIIGYMVKEQIPVTKEFVAAASEWLKNLDDGSNGLETIKMAALKNIPASGEILSSLHMLKEEKPLHLLISETLASLDSSAGKDSAEQLEKVLKSFISPSTVEKARDGLPILMREWLNSGKLDSASLQVLQETGFVPDKIPLNKMSLLDNHLLLGKFESGETAELLDPKTLPGEIKNLLNSLLGTDDDSSESNKEVIHNRTVQVLKMLGADSNTVSGAERKLADLIQQISENGNEELEQGLAELLLKNNVPDWGKGKEAAHHLKQLLALLGYGYEKDLASLGSRQEPKMESDALKPLLIQYLNDHKGTGQDEAAQHLLQRITGMQLLSSDNSPMVQYLTQIPIQFWNRTTDLTIQWSGRKQDDGKIDPNYCRVLFYLDLEKLGNTTIDMQVQNRVMRIAVSSENKAIKEAAAPFIKPLKNKLKVMEYHLSAISFDYGDEQVKEKQKGILSSYKSESYGGVDFRI
ncbi:hypothetical protein [Neobacillus terrae]|uniref:hypothetical protein n=1 Tax=Neobacillus terrae TaxID=3034837 RepID=UPI00140941B8|nr:hypothetical protein [Neobacillus terrae]NHM29777.1 hypothetical protein [Neobacillus terrae]